MSNGYCGWGCPPPPPPGMDDRNRFRPENRFVGDIEDGKRYPFDVYKKSETYNKEEVYNKQESDDKYETKSDAEDIRASIAAKADASDVADLSATVETKADTSALSALSGRVNAKADTEDVNAAVADLQTQINQIEISSSAEAVVAPEVIAARVDADGTEYETLKERIDSLNTADAGLETEIGYTSAALDGYVNQVADVTLAVESGLWSRADYTFVKGRRYAFTNLTSDKVNFRVHDAAGTTTVIVSSINAGVTYFYNCDNNYVAFSSYAQQSGNVVLATVDDGFFKENERTRDYGALVDIDEICNTNNRNFTIERIGNGVKFTTKSGATGNTGVSIPVLIDKLSIKSIEFDIESSNGSPQIFVGKNSGVTHIKRIIRAANSTFDKQHIIFDIPALNLADGDDATLSIWNADNAEADGYFIVSNIEFKRDTTHRSVDGMKDYTSFVDFDSLLSQSSANLNLEKVGNGIKFTTDHDVVSGNNGVSLSLPVETYSIKSVEFDIESAGGSPQIFIGKNGGVTHIQRIVYGENETFDKRHIAFDLPETNLADGDEVTFSIWNADNALADGYFIISNFTAKRDTNYNKISNLNAADIPISNKLLSDMTQVRAWSHGTVAKYDDYITYTPVDGENGGIQSPTILESKRGFLAVEFDLDVTYHSDLRVYLFGKSTQNTSLYIQIENNIRNAGTYKVSIDLNHYVVYQNLDLDKPVSVALTTVQANNAEVVKLSRFNVYDSTSALEIDGTVSDGLNYVYNAVESISNKMDSMSSNLKLTDENGNTYLLQVSNGRLELVPTLASNILYIGNSLLLGFQTFGMAASNSSEDYYHYVNEYLSNQGLALTTDRLMGKDWENCTSYADQNAWMENSLLPKLNDNLELVIVQLGDNVNTSEKQAVFAQGTINLLRYIRQHTSHARIAWVGAWYTSPTRQQQMAEACRQCNATFVDISLLPDVAGNRNHVGAIYVDDNNIEHEIVSSGVASHPSSQGMRAVADAIIEALF